MTRQAAKKTRDALSESVSWVTRKREMIVFRKGRKPVAALVPIGDAKLIEALQDEIDLREARKALRERGSVPWEKVKKDLGL
jgi:hypothetical protein